MHSIPPLFYFPQLCTPKLCQMIEAIHTIGRPRCTPLLRSPSPATRYPPFSQPSHAFIPWCEFKNAYATLPKEKEKPTQVWQNPTLTAQKRYKTVVATLASTKLKQSHPCTKSLLDSISDGTHHAGPTSASPSPSTRALINTAHHCPSPSTLSC